MLDKNYLINEKLKSDDPLISQIAKMLKDKIGGDTQLQEGILNESKNLINLKKYIMRKAKKELKSKSGYIEPEIVLGWAIHYFTEEIDIDSIEDKVDKEIPKRKQLVKKGIKKKVQVTQLDLFGEYDVL